LAQVFVALFAFFIIPDFPRTTTWLTEEEKQLAAWRLDEDIGEDDWVNSKQQTFLHGAKLAVKYACSPSTSIPRTLNSQTTLPEIQKPGYSSQRHTVSQRPGQ
jgi:hypothetical protein